MLRIVKGTVKGTTKGRLTAILATAWLSMLGCGGVQAVESSPATPQGESGAPVLLAGKETPRFRFRGLDGREVSSEVALGRNSVVAFLSTFDWASQAQARFLSGIERHHRPRTNCYAIVIEEPENEMLVESFVATLSLRFPVAHVPSERLLKTDLRKVKTVPTVWVLDGGTRVMWKSQGLATQEVLEQVLAAVEGRGARR
jgi:hypothetical protein